MDINVSFHIDALSQTRVAFVSCIRMMGQVSFIHGSFEVVLHRSEMSSLPDHHLSNIQCQSMACDKFIVQSEQMVIHAPWSDSESARERPPLSTILRSSTAWKRFGTRSAAINCTRARYVHDCVTQTHNMLVYRRMCMPIPSRDLTSCLRGMRT